MTDTNERTMKEYGKKTPALDLLTESLHNRNINEFHYDLPDNQSYASAEYYIRKSAKIHYMRVCIRRMSIDDPPVRWLIVKRRD